jgi:hypothetical protein
MHVMRGIATAALIGLPIVASAQTHHPTSQKSKTQPAPQQATSVPNQQLSEARRALNEIPSSISGEAAQKIAELKTHFDALENAYHSGGKASATRSATAGGDWTTHYTAIDRILTDLLGPSSGAAATTGTASATGAVGTTGAPSATGGTAARSGSSALDDTTRAKLVEFRTHLTAFATGGAPTTPSAKGSSPSYSGPGTSAATGPTAASPAMGTTAGTAASAQSGTSGRTGMTGQMADPNYHLDLIVNLVNQALAASSTSTTGTSGTVTGTTGTATTPTGTAGTTGTEASVSGGTVTVDRAKLEQIKQHVEHVKQLLSEKKPQ